MYDPCTWLIKVMQVESVGKHVEFKYLCIFIYAPFIIKIYK